MSLLASNENSKTKLTFLIQKLLKRNLSRGDVEYKSGKVEGGTGFEATVLVNAMEGQPSFSGTSETDRKGAEYDAAYKALEFYDEDVQRLIAEHEAKGKRQHLSQKEREEREAAAEGEPAEKRQKCRPGKAGRVVISLREQQIAAGMIQEKEPVVVGTATPIAVGRVSHATVAAAQKSMPDLPKPAPMPAEEQAAPRELEPASGKSKLYDFLTRAIKRTPKPAELKWDVQQRFVAQGHKGYIVTLTMVCLPERWAGRSWESDLSKNLKSAEHSAAEKCYDDLATDPEWLPVVQLLNKKAARKEQEALWNDPGAAWGMVYKQVTDQAKKAKVRQPVATSVKRGKVLYIQKGGWGYIEPEGKIDHPKADKRGKLYFASKDIIGATDKEPPEWFKEGVRVSFTVYVENTGCGAENVDLAEAADAADEAAAIAAEEAKAEEGLNAFLDEGKKEEEKVEEENN
eukprot:TRINITY_DN25592_c0_g1_i1.p1 TRINITY_DN25592_c0_g1~~TRINITY_DN25592_c0_g1_i1.p1  ORF type:complete len:458 (+),score=143.00 TRINITY_DN25592_c0_g1_i1:73-1446(+)